MTNSTGAAELPEALQIAAALENPINVVDQKAVAICLRRLHAQVEALSAAQAGVPAEQCVICGAEEPYSGSCGSNDPRALCKTAAAPQPSPYPAPDRPEPHLYLCLGPDGWFECDKYQEGAYALYSALGLVDTPAPAQPGQEGERGYEHDRAIMEGERNASLVAFDHDGGLTLAEERLYESAFANGWDRHAAVAAQTPAPMSPANRLVAYSAATRLMELGFEWDAAAEAWLQPAASQVAARAAPQPATADAVDAVDAARLEFLCSTERLRMIECEKQGFWRVYQDEAPAEAAQHHWQAMTSEWHPTARAAIDAAQREVKP